MKKRVILLAMLVLTALLTTGCAMRTVEEMYTPPKRSEEYKELQAAIDTAMFGLSFSSPKSGENQQTVQMADLDGDGMEEYLVFAKGASEKPLQVLIFQQDKDGRVRTMETIGFNGTGFEQVEYVQMDEHPGYELVVGIQVSDQVLRSVAVYTFVDGDAQLLLLNGYSKFLACDLDENGREELMVFRPGEAESERGMAVFYSALNGALERSVETELSGTPIQIRRILNGRLTGEKPAVFVASMSDNNEIVTDIFTIKDGQFTNIAVSGDIDTSIRTLRNHYIYADDIDNDGIMELPSLMTMKPVTLWRDEEQKYFLRWYSLDADGRETDKMFTYHNYSGGWYLQLDKAWASRVTVDPRQDGTFVFYVWDESYEIPTELFTIYVFTGSGRDENTTQDGRFPLYRAEGVAYAARLAEGASLHEITTAYLTGCFRMIRQDWQTGDA